MPSDLPLGYIQVFTSAPNDTWLDISDIIHLQPDTAAPDFVYDIPWTQAARDMGARLFIKIGHSDDALQHIAKLEYQLGLKDGFNQATKLYLGPTVPQRGGLADLIKPNESN
jgi:hypothetical protein